MTQLAVIFDMDGVIIDSEQIWDEVRRDLTLETGGNWLDEAQVAMMGMSSPEWSKYMADTLNVPMDPQKISDVTVERLIERYHHDVPVLPNAIDGVKAAAKRGPIAIASSSNRPVIDAVLEHLQLTSLFSATVSSEEVAKGKPNPDVYLAAAAKLGVDPASCVAVEDSSNGIRAAANAGMTVVAVPNIHYPPAADALERATVIMADLSGLSSFLGSLS